MEYDRKHSCRIRFEFYEAFKWSHALGSKKGRCYLSIRIARYCGPILVRKNTTTTFIFLTKLMFPHKNCNYHIPEASDKESLIKKTSRIC
ncbi:hypothetical protein C5167_044465 [Papaver somniferum]|uniref:Uncharacterized protein n=1 Tax=Papaver somniferum TaxID=3469 RepID=A0A4Y7LCK2_PAPSO|nr:hypothetical protein C5167_044465 [Papaver somniferum]